MSMSLVNLLGTDTDAALGRQFNLSRERVRQLRAEKGIPPFTQPRGKPKLERDITAMLALPAETLEALAQAGTVSDSELAKRLRLDSRLVAAYRRHHNIEVFVAPPAYDAEQTAILKDTNIPPGEAAERVGCSPMTVWRYRHRA